MKYPEAMDGTAPLFSSFRPIVWAELLYIYTYAIYGWIRASHTVQCAKYLAQADNSK